MRLYRLPGETHEGHYKRAVTLFKARYQAPQSELAVRRRKLNAMTKGPDEAIGDYVRRFEQAWTLAYPGQSRVGTTAMEDKWMLFISTLELDVQRLYGISQKPAPGADWITLTAHLEYLYTLRDPHAMVDTARSAVRLNRAKQQIMEDDRPTQLANGVHRPNVEYTDMRGHRRTLPSFYDNPYEAPTPTLETIHAIGERAPAAAASSSGGSAPQQSKGKRKRGKRGRSDEPTTDDEPPAASSQHDGRGNEANREHQRALAAKKPRDEKGHFVKREGNAPATGSNATPLGSRAVHKGRNTAGREVEIRGPCSGCGLNHTWERCRRNKNWVGYKEEEGRKTGKHWIAAIPGYKLGDEIEGSYKALPGYEDAHRRAFNEPPPSAVRRTTQ
jgi:hypothetical protein